MKRLFLLMLCVGVMYLGGCQNKSAEYNFNNETLKKETIDEKTDIEKNEKLPVKMVRVDDELYYDTGRETDSYKDAFMGRSLMRYFSEYEVPTENSKSNFYDADYYQYRVKIDAVEVLCDDKWRLFKRINSEEDVLKYKYCMIFKGRMSNAESDGKFLVLANDENITFDDVSYALNGADTSKSKDIYILPIDSEAEKTADEISEKERLNFTDEMLNNYKYFLGEKEYSFNDAEYEFEEIKLKFKSVEISPYRKHNFTDVTMYVIKFKYDVENTSSAPIRFKFDHEESWVKNHENTTKMVVNTNFGGDYGELLPYATLQPGEIKEDVVVSYFVNHDNRGNHLFYIDDIIEVNAPIGINGNSYDMLFEIDTLK